MSSYNKIPYDAAPISREGGGMQRQNVVRNKFSHNLFIAAIFIFNIIISVLFIHYINNNSSKEIINLNTTIYAEATVSAEASSKAKLSSVCIAAGGMDNDRESFSFSNKPDYNEFFTMTNQGAGVIFDVNKLTGEAYILTCNHVVSSYSNAVFVVLYDSYVPIYATVIGKSTKNDIAVLKISSEVVSQSLCSAATIADSSLITEGEPAIAVGNPLRGGFAVTSGTISNTSVFVKISGLNLRTIQVDTAINRGNSGGGLYNKNGDLIGIVQSKKESVQVDNMANALHINGVISIANNLIENRQLQYADLGITFQKGIQAEIQQIDGIKYKFDQIYVQDVVEGSDAENLLLPRDRIIAFTYNGKTVQVVNAYSFSEIKFDFKYGDTIKFTIIRDGSVLEETVEVTVSQLKSDN